MKKALTFIFLFTIILTSYSQTELDDDAAESKLLVNNDRLIVLDFYATWCGPCKRMEPIVKQLEKEYPNVDFYKIDVDKSTVDDALGINAMPTYLFIKNSSNLEQIEGAMSKEKMAGLIEKHMNVSTTINASNNEESNDEFYDATEHHGHTDEFTDDTTMKIWDSSTKLNSLAWHTYKEHEDVKSLLKAIKIVERSIDLEATYYNVDTHAALLYKTGNYTKALKKAKEAIEIAKSDGLEYGSTTELIEKIIDEL
jgi:thioredoxin 1